MRISGHIQHFPAEEHKVTTGINLTCTDRATLKVKETLLQSVYSFRIGKTYR